MRNICKKTKFHSIVSPLDVTKVLLKKNRFTYLYDFTAVSS